MSVDEEQFKVQVPFDGFGGSILQKRRLQS